MANFDVIVHPIDLVEPHPNADRLEMARVGSWACVVAPGQFQAGDLAAYIPEGAIVPQDLLVQLGLEGKLAGPEFNRVRAVMLRGQLSQGLLVPARPGWLAGQSVMAELGVEKFNPGVPDGAQGQRYVLEEDEYLPFDVENIKDHPDLLVEGEEVVMTEKLHGTFIAVGARAGGAPGRGHYQDLAWVASKGVLDGRNGFVIDEANLYVGAAMRAGWLDKAIEIASIRGRGVCLLGEVVGQGIQDLGYGVAGGAPQLRAFAVLERCEEGQGLPCGWRYLDEDEMVAVLDSARIERAPIVYRGPFSQEALENATNGRETMSGKALHVREGVVVVPVHERIDTRLPAMRVALKSVSAGYLTRKGGTEFS